MPNDNVTNKKTSNKGKMLGIILIVLGLVCVVVSLVMSNNQEPDKKEENNNKTEEKTEEDPDVEKTTDDFQINSYSAIGNKVSYGAFIQIGEEYIFLTIDAKEYNLPDNLYNYADDIVARLTYNKENQKVYDCQIINVHTGQVIEDVSKENIEKLFNIEYGKTINDKTWTDTIKLSELEEGQVYKYSATTTTQFPTIENDIGKNCMIYIKENDDDTYNREINMAKRISSSGLSLSYDQYSAGDSFKIAYKVLENEEIVKLVEKEKIIYLSKYQNGEEIKNSIEDYIYNDTDHDITINTKDTSFGQEKTDSYTIGKGEIYFYDWTIDSATISY